MAKSTLAFLLFIFAANAQSHKMSVQIVQRQSSTTEYTYTVPGYATSNCNASAYANSASGNCVASEHPAQSGGYSVHGATFSLLLPDGRIAIVNCNAKPRHHTDWGGHNWYRDCRQPLVDTVDVDFDGDKAKLEWNVSIDGKKKESETYKIIAILAKIPEAGAK